MLGRRGDLKAMSRYTLTILTLGLILGLSSVLLFAQERIEKKSPSKSDPPKVIVPSRSAPPSAKSTPTPQKRPN